MKIKSLTFDLVTSQDQYLPNYTVFRIEVVTDSGNIFGYNKMFMEDDFVPMFDRLMDDAKYMIKSDVAKMYSSLLLNDTGVKNAY